MTGPYQNVCQSWDREFERNRQVHGDRIQCRSGCSACCSQLFQITEPEAAEVSRAVQAMEPGAAGRLRTRAARYLIDRADLLAERGAGIEEEAWGSLPPPGARLECPALSEEGACQIYAYRPLICRKFGVPLWNPDRPGRVYACHLNFKDGEAIEDPELIQIQTGLHQQWKQLQGEYNQRGGHREEKPLTIARAILEDFSALL